MKRPGRHLRHYKSGKVRFINPFVAKAKRFKKRHFGDIESTIEGAGQSDLLAQLGEMTGSEQARGELLEKQSAYAGAMQALTTAQAQAAETEQSLLYKKYAAQIQKNKKALAEANAKINQTYELSEAEKGRAQAETSKIELRQAAVDQQMASWKSQSADLDTKADYELAREKARGVYAELKKSQERYEALRRQLRKKYGILMRTPGFTIRPISLKPIRVSGFGGRDEAVA